MAKIKNSRWTCKLGIWTKKDKEVKVRFWDTNFLGHATARDIHKYFMEVSAQSDSFKLI